MVYILLLYYWNSMYFNVYRLMFNVFFWYLRRTFCFKPQACHFCTISVTKFGIFHIWSHYNTSGKKKYSNKQRNTVHVLYESLLLWSCIFVKAWNIYLPFIVTKTFFKTSPFGFHWEKKCIQARNNMRVSKYGQHFQLFVNKSLKTLKTYTLHLSMTYLCTW